jgi:putative transposase
VRANLDQRAAGKTHALGADELTPSLGWSAFPLVKEGNGRKRAVAPWSKENSKHVNQAA